MRWDEYFRKRSTEFKRDILGRLIHTLARDSGDKVQETVY